MTYAGTAMSTAEQCSSIRWFPLPASDLNGHEELVDSVVLEISNFTNDALKQFKFVHRLMGFLRPFKFRFSDAPNTKANQRYVRTACALVKCLLQHNDGVAYLASAKVVPQIAECLAQFDPMSGITSKTPLFSPERLAETLVGGYFAMLGRR